MDQQQFKNTIFILKDRMFRFAKILLGSEEDAFDSVQDVMVRLWQNRDKIDGYENPEAYVMRCVKNECLSRQRHQQVVDRFKTVQKTEPTVEFSHDNTIALILNIMKQLPEKQKLIIHLRDIEAYEIKEIASLLQMEEGAVRINLMRGRQKIKFQLEKIWIYEQKQTGR